MQHHKHSGLGPLLIPTNTSIAMHLEILVYADKNPAPEWGDQSAKQMSIYTKHVNSALKHWV